MNTLKVLAAVLHYPSDDLRQAAPALAEIVTGDRRLSTVTRRRLSAFIAAMAEADGFDLEERYVETFDRGRACSLHLFEHVHGESRDRGPAMVELQQVYADHGLAIDRAELPDYLPLFLEFCAELPAEDAGGWLEEVGPLLQMLHARLAKRESGYRDAVAAALEIAGVPVEDDSVRALVADQPRDDDPASLDRDWAEAPVTFEPGSACDSLKQRPGAAQAVTWGAPRQGMDN